MNTVSIHSHFYVQVMGLRLISVNFQVAAVIAGFDPFISYSKLIKAVTYLNNKDCAFVATNEDVVFPQSDSGLVMPGKDVE